MDVIKAYLFKARAQSGPSPSKRVPGACQGFLKGGVQYPKKWSSDFKRGSNGLMGRVQYISLSRMTNLAYLDAKE